MATLTTSQFGLQLSGVPLLNIRLDFNSLLALFRSERFRSQFRGPRGKRIPIKTHYFTWHGRPEVLLTYFLRDSIVGLESAVSGAVFAESLARGTMNDEILEATKNPFVLPGKGTADRVFNALPSLIDRDFSLEKRASEKWTQARLFYKEVRNPLFHAYEIARPEPEPVWQALEFIWVLFQWINSWHSIESVAGPIRLSNPKMFTEIPEVSDFRVSQVIPERKIDSNPERDVTLPLGLDQAPDIEDVLGMYLPSEPKVCFTMRANHGRPVNMDLSAQAAMKMLVYLATAHRKRGWEIPDRL